MPIEYSIDDARRLVIAKAVGVFNPQDLFIYQREVWSRPEVAGFDELIDMSAVERIEKPSAERMRELARLSATMDAPSGSSKFAIVAPDDLAFGLGRMYQTYRGLEQRGAKKVGVFRTMTEALAFLAADVCE